MTTRPALNIALRGHVRESMSDSRLADLVGGLSESFDVKVFAHTWNVQQNSLSWRNLECVPEIVNEEKIRSYLESINVASVIVEKDEDITHPGNTHGCVGRTKCPILGWKNMYYGKFRVCSMIKEVEPPDSATMQMRFDILSNPFSPKKDELLDFAKREFEFISGDAGDEKIRFLKMRCFLGVDNVYMARIEDMHRFVSYMYFDMDRILEVHKRSYNQEHIAFHERKWFLNYEQPS